MKHPSHLHLDWSPAETFGNASDLHERLVQSAYPRSHLMKCVGKRPPLHICKSHLPLSSNCRRRVSFLFCNMSCYPLWVWQVRLTFVNTLLPFPSVWCLHDPDGWGCSQPDLWQQLPGAGVIFLAKCHCHHAGISQNWSSESDPLGSLMGFTLLHRMWLEFNEIHWTDNNSVVVRAVGSDTG